MAHDRGGTIIGMLVLVAAALLLAACSTRRDERITDWCLIRYYTGPSFGHYSGSTSSECRIKRFGFWWTRLDEPAVGTSIALDPDTVLLSTPGVRKLLRRGETRAIAPCADDVVTLPQDLGVIDCVGFVAGPAPAFPTTVRIRRLDRHGRRLTEYQLDVRDLGRAPAIAVENPGEPRALAAEEGAEAVSAHGASLVFMGPTVRFYDGANNPYLVVFDEDAHEEPECALLALEGDRQRSFRAPRGTKIGDCSETDFWSQLIGRTLSLPR